MAILEQERHVEYVTGAVEHFVITSTMISATLTELPHLEIFVLTVNDRIDPKADTLARVARISDLTTLSLTRDLALAGAAGTGMEFLSQSVAVNYPTLTEAEAAKQAIQDRVNALIQDWTTFTTDFNAPEPTPQLITLPTVDPSQKDALIAAYRAAKEARYTAQQAKTAADTALALANSTYTAAATTAADFAAFVTTASILNTQMNTAAGGMSTLKNAGDVFLGVATATAPEVAAFTAALNAGASQIVQNTSYQSAHASFAGAMSGYLSGTLTPAQTAAQVALTAAQAAQITAAQTLTSDLAAEAAALAAVLAICPDFLSTSVCNVPG